MHTNPFKSKFRGQSAQLQPIQPIQFHSNAHRNPNYVCCGLFFPWVGCPSSLDIILEGTAPGQHEKPQPKPKWPSPWFVFNPRTSRGDVSTFSHLKGENCATVVLNVSRESREILRLPDLENENTYSGSIKHVQTTQNTIQHHWTSSPKPFSSSSSSSHRQTGN